jgi:hypothetical protein
MFHNWFFEGAWLYRLLKNCSLRGVILSATGAPGNGRFCRCWGGGAKDLLFARAEDKADPSVAQNRRDLRMTLLRVFQQPL